MGYKYIPVGPNFFQPIEWREANEIAVGLIACAIILFAAYILTNRANK